MTGHTLSRKYHYDTLIYCMENELSKKGLGIFS
jgi:hypothetical protein